METLELSQPISGFEPEAFYAALASLPDLPWLAQFKESAWERYNALPYPDRGDEPFRFASVKRASDRGFCYDDRPGPRGLEGRSTLVSDPAGRLVLANDYVVACELNAELAEKGVLFMPLAEALQKHPELVREYYVEVLQGLGAEKALALHTALNRNGSFLYVPDGVRVEKPFINYYWAGVAQRAVFPHAIVVAGKESEFSCVDYFGNAEDSEKTFVSSASLVHAGAGAKVLRTRVQDFNERSVSFHCENLVAEAGAEPTCVNVNLGCHYARQENVLRITGSEASARLYGLTVAAGDQEFDQRTLQIHSAPNAFSDLLYKNALLEKAHTIFSGLIKVDEVAQQTDAYQTNRNLQLSPDAEAHSLPGLEILANDVKCSHGATTGRLDESELFYMRSRGIPPVEARRLMVFGFFEEILEKVHCEELADALRMHLHAKFDAIANRQHR